MKEVFLSLGSNLGDKLENLSSAIKYINNLIDTKVIYVSGFYETEPFGVPQKQDNYINCCLKLETTLSPQMLMGACLGIESALGRKRDYRFCPRTIDIDILLYENENIHQKNLTIPHPRMFERAFVTVPLHDINKEIFLKNKNLNAATKQYRNSEIKKLNIKYDLKLFKYVIQ